MMVLVLFLQLKFLNKNIEPAVAEPLLEMLAFLTVCFSTGVAYLEQVCILEKSKGIICIQYLLGASDAKY